MDYIEPVEPIPEPPTDTDRLYTGPYCVPCDDRKYCILALMSCMAARTGAERSPLVSDAWHTFAEGLIAFYGEDFWREELAAYVVKHATVSGR